MSLIGGFSVPADEFALATSLAAAPSTRVEAERLASHSRAWVMPFLRAYGEGVEAFEAELADDPTVEEWRTLDRFEGSTLYAVTWSDVVESLVDQMIDREAVVRRARASGEEWYLELRFSDADSLSAFRECFDTFRLHRKYRATDSGTGRYGLTPEQRETLVVAADEGYFSVPREATVEDLADELGVSANSVSQRLRRAHDALVRNALLVERAEVGAVGH